MNPKEEPKPHVCFLDTETTGVDPEICELLEIAAYTPAHLHEPGKAEWFKCYVKPENPIPPEASAVHHITDKDLVDAELPSEIDDDFRNFMDPGKAPLFLVAHNIPYDYKILTRYFPWLADMAPEVLPECRLIDTLRWAKHVLPGLPSYKIQVLRYRYDLAPEGLAAHRADADVKVLYNLFHLLVNATGRPVTLPELIEAIKKPLVVEVMRFGKYRDMPTDKMVRRDLRYAEWLMKQDWLPVSNPDLYYTLTNLLSGKTLDQIQSHFLC